MLEAAASEADVPGMSTAVLGRRKERVFGEEEDKDLGEAELCGKLSKWAQESLRGITGERGRREVCEPEANTTNR